VRRLDWSLPALIAASANLDSAVMIDPSFALAYAVKSRANTMLAWVDPSGNYQKIARESFEKALKIQPNLSYGHMAAGIFYNLTETDYDSAMTELDRATSELHNDADLVTNIALVEWRQGKFDEADENFRKAVDLDPLNPSVHSWRSQFFRFRRMFADAEQSINRAIALDPKRGDFYVEKLAGYVSRYGDWNKNREVVREALSQIDTLEFVRAVGGGTLDSLLGGHLLKDGVFINRYREDSRKKLDAISFYQSLAIMYRDAGNAALTTVYLDSTRSTVEQRLKVVPNDALLSSALGGVLAYLGSCTKAVEFGIRGKELLSIAKCHW
jgi:tetratricopeptide (TPR) repeat protein